jgi:hypothetical protein
MEQVITYQPTGPSSPAVKREETINLQFSAILESAIRKSADSVIFFERMGETSSLIMNKAFFLYLSVKKNAQLAILEKIAYCFGLEKSFAVEGRQISECLELNENKSEEEYGTIFHTIHEIAADELEFYMNYAELERDTKIKSFILMLADLSKEFLFDVKIWYLNHKDTPYILNGELQETVGSGYRVETVFN